MWNKNLRKRKIINSFYDINEALINNNNFMRDGYGHMWKIENNKLFYKPKSINNFFEVKIEGGWFIDPVECIEVENYKNN